MDQVAAQNPALSQYIEQVVQESNLPTEQVWYFSYSNQHVLLLYWDIGSVDHLSRYNEFSFFANSLK